MLKINVAPELLPDNIAEEAKQFSTTLLCDAMAGFGAMDYRIKPIMPGMKVVGTAFTVNLKAGTALAVIAAVALASKGYVLIIGGNGDRTNALFGDLMAQTAIKGGIDGVVIDGLVRDIAQLRQDNLPLFAAGATPTAAVKDGSGQINSPAVCGGVAVDPGDLIVGDDDGVVVIPRDLIDDVFAAARAKAAAECKRVQEIEQGILMPEWLRKRIADS